MRLKLAGVALLALGTIAATGTAAEARDGCGPGFHRGYYGYCRPNLRPWAYGPRFYGPPVVYRYGWHRPWGGYRHVGWRHAGWHGGGWGWHRAGWHRW